MEVKRVLIITKLVSGGQSEDFIPGTCFTPELLTSLLQNILVYPSSLGLIALGDMDMHLNNSNLV